MSKTTVTTMHCDVCESIIPSTNGNFHDYAIKVFDEHGNAMAINKVLPTDDLNHFQIANACHDCVDAVRKALRNRAA